MSHPLLLLFLLVSHFAFSQTHELDSLYRALEKHPQQDTDRALILFKICYREYEARPEKSKALAEELLLLSKKIKYVKGESVAFRYLSEYYQNIGDHGQATKYAYLWLDASEKSSYQVGVARASEMIGLIKELEGDFKSSIANYTNAIAIYQKAKFKSDLGFAYNNLAGVYRHLSKPDSSYEYMMKAMEIMKELNNENGLGVIYLNLGEIFLAKKEYAKAIYFFENSVPLNKKLNNQARLRNCFAGLGETYLNIQKFDKAEYYLLESLTIAKEINGKTDLKDSYRVLALLERKRGRLEKAIAYSDLKFAYHDSIYTEEKAKQIAEIETRYETEKKDQQIKLLEKDKRIQLLWRNIFITALIFVTLLSVFVYFLQRYRERKNRDILNLQIDYLTNQHKELNERYKDTLSIKDEKTIASHDQRLLKKAIEVIEHNLSDPLFSVEKMSEEMGMSRTNMHRKLKAITGFPPSELIRNIRLRKAALLLRNETDSISQISFAVGFEEHSYFSKAFKKQYGVTPSDYLQSTKAVEV